LQYRAGCYSTGQGVTVQGRVLQYKAVQCVSMFSSPSQVAIAGSEGEPGAVLWCRVAVYRFRGIGLVSTVTTRCASPGSTQRSGRYRHGAGVEEDGYNSASYKREHVTWYQLCFTLMTSSVPTPNNDDMAMYLM
jgi:hypothetical protein